MVGHLVGVCLGRMYGTSPVREPVLVTMKESLFVVRPGNRRTSTLLTLDFSGTLMRWTVPSDKDSRPRGLKGKSDRQEIVDGRKGSRSRRDLRGTFCSTAHPLPGHTRDVTR